MCLSVKMRFLLPSLLLNAAVAQGVTFALTCSNYPSVCNHKCYATYVAGKTDIANWDAPSKALKTNRRMAAGAIPNPCCPNAQAPHQIKAPAGNSCYEPDGTRVACTSPDEYPYASTVEGGQGTGSALIRCTGALENSKEGADLGGFLTRNIADGGCGSVRGCRFNIAYAFYNSIES